MAALATRRQGTSGVTVGGTRRLALARRRLHGYNGTPVGYERQHMYELMAKPANANVAIIELAFHRGQRRASSTFSCGA